MILLPDFSTVGMRGQKKTIFLYSIWSGFTHTPTSGILVDDYRKMDRGSMIFLTHLFRMHPFFFYEAIYALRTLFQKNIYVGLV